MFVFFFFNLIVWTLQAENRFEKLVTTQRSRSTSSSKDKPTSRDTATSRDSTTTTGRDSRSKESSESRSKDSRDSRDSSSSKSRDREKTSSRDRSDEREKRSDSPTKAKKYFIPKGKVSMKNLRSPDYETSVDLWSDTIAMV